MRPEKKGRQARPIPGRLPRSIEAAGPDVTIQGIIEGGPDDGRTVSLNLPNDEALVWAEAIIEAVARNRSQRESYRSLIRSETS